MTLMKAGCRGPRPRAMQIGDLDVEADDFVRLGRVRFNKRRAALWVPAQRNSRFRWRGADGQRYQCCERRALGQTFDRGSRSGYC